MKKKLIKNILAMTRDRHVSSLSPAAVMKMVVAFTVVMAEAIVVPIIIKI